MGCSYGAVKGEVSSCGFYCLMVSIGVLFITNDYKWWCVCFVAVAVVVELLSCTCHVNVGIEADGLSGVIRLDGLVADNDCGDLVGIQLCRYHISYNGLISISRSVVLHRVTHTILYNVYSPSSIQQTNIHKFIIYLKGVDHVK